MKTRWPLCTLYTSHQEETNKLDKELSEKGTENLYETMFSCMKKLKNVTQET